MTRHLYWIASLSLALTSPALALDPIVIGVSLPLSGNLGADGQSVWEGIKAAHNLKQRVLDRPVELKLRDTKSEKAEAAEAVFRLIERDHVTAIIGNTESVYLRSAYPTADGLGLPMVVPSALGLVVTCRKRQIFELCSSDRSLATVTADLAVGRLNAKTAVIVYDMSDECSVGLAAGFRRQFAGMGSRVVLQTGIKAGDRDFTAQINQIRTAKPDIVYAPIHHLESTLLAKQARDMGVDATLVVGATVHVPELKPLANLLPTALFQDSRSEIQAAQAVGAEAYVLLLDAIARAGSDRPEKIREATETICGFERFRGATGTTEKDECYSPAKPPSVDQVSHGRFVNISEAVPARER